MNLKFKRMNALVLSALMAASMVAPVNVFAAEDDKTVVIYHTNDTHSRVDNFAKAKTYINLDEADAKFLFDAGDTLHGQPFATLTDGSSIIRIMNAMGYDAMTTGNHDYNYGYKHLLELGEEMNFPILAANVKKGSKVVFDDTVIIERDGVKVGVFGLATPETKVKANPKYTEDLDFGDVKSMTRDAQRAVNKLERKGCDIIVGLGHLGVDEGTIEKSTVIADALEGVDLFIDGHSHSTLDAYEEFNATHDTKIVSTGGNFEGGLGRVEITLDENEEITGLTYETVAAEELETLESAPEIQTVVDEVNKDVEPIKSEVINTTPIELVGERSVVRFGHSNLGYLLADALIDQTGADIAITNGGGIRASIDKGEITKGEVVTVLPFGNFVVTKELTGHQIKNILNYGLAIGEGRFTHFSGMDVTTEIYDNNGVKTHKVVDMKFNGEEMDLDRTYVVATNDFMAAGGDGYTEFANGKEVGQFSGLDEVLIAYLKTLSPEEIAAYDNVSHLNGVEVVEKWALNEDGQWTYGTGTKWVASHSDWYYVVDGLMQTNTTITTDGIDYYVGADGAWVR